VPYIIMGFGLIMRKNMGSRCRRRRRCSEEEIGPIFERYLGKELFLVFLRISREYMAPKTVARVTTGKEAVFQSIIVDMMRSSPIKLGVGGSPRLEMQVMTHHNVRRGVINLNPRVMAKVRVFFRS